MYHEISVLSSIFRDFLKKTYTRKFAKQTQAKKKNPDSEKDKHLTLEDRIDIAEYLANGLNFKEIAHALKKELRFTFSSVEQ